MGRATRIRYIAVPIGLVFAVLSLGLERLPERFVVLLVPGLMASMAFSGNVHDFPLWPAAIINGLLYFALAWAGAAVITKVVTRTNH